ncbi:MAG: hypothetical protein NW214_12075 [Pseudanabaenaceae cyanobacterium bins.39]|nr:hypothetical protein [Pseudanabaenaceae cyanobacterium bins.39]
MVDPSQIAQQTDMVKIAIPKELENSIQEIISLYKHPQYQQHIINALQGLITIGQTNPKDRIYKSSHTVNTSPDPQGSLNNGSLTEDDESGFLRSWDDLLNFQVYVDTDIYGELDPRPPALKEIEQIAENETIIQHGEATEAYVQSWKELAQNMTSYPEDIFTRLWTTKEISEILECSASSLRRARRSQRLPIRVKDLILDCISHDGKRSLWFARPA